MKSAVAVLIAIAIAPMAAQIPQFASSVDGVRVDTLVMDGKRLVTGLTADHFELRDNGVLQRITDVSRETLPLNVICVLDVSGSVAGPPLRQLKDATRALFDALVSGDRAALVTFSHRLRLHTGLTGDRGRLGALVGAVTAGGSSAFLDATFAGLALRESDERRAVLLLFTDGSDNASWLPATDVLDAARRSDVVVYPVRSAPDSVDWRTTERTQSIETPGPREAARLLEKLADDTGGRVMEAANDRALRSTFLGVLSEFRQRYVLSYSPSGVSKDGWHTIDVKLRGRSGQVTARRGYFAAAPPATTRTPSGRK